MNLAPEIATEEIRMPWPLICRMACMAMILNMSIDEFAEAALDHNLRSHDVLPRR